MEQPTQPTKEAIRQDAFLGIDAIVDKGAKILDALADRIRTTGSAPPIGVDQLLALFGYSRRGRSVIAKIRRELAIRGLTTVPDFESSGLDSKIRLQFLPMNTVAKSNPSGAPVETAPEIPVEQGSAEADFGVGLLIGTLQSGRALVSVFPEDQVTIAETRMLLEDYSQLPVLKGRSDVRGVVTWRSISQARRNGVITGQVTDFMDTDYRVTDASTPLFRILPDLIRLGFVLIRDQQRSVSGIITTTDVAASFGEQFEPFALLGEIENHLRRIVSTHFSIDECRAGVDPADASRKIDSVHDMTFGEYLRLIESSSSWSKLSWGLDRAAVVKSLSEIRVIRNDVMHFSPDPITSASIKKLRTFVDFIRPLK